MALNFRHLFFKSMTAKSLRFMPPSLLFFPRLDYFIFLFFCFFTIFFFYFILTSNLQGFFFSFLFNYLFYFFGFCNIFTSSAPSSASYLLKKQFVYLFLFVLSCFQFYFMFIHIFVYEIFCGVTICLSLFWLSVTV